MDTTGGQAGGRRRGKEEGRRREVGVRGRAGMGGGRRHSAHLDSLITIHNQRISNHKAPRRLIK